MTTRPCATDNDDVTIVRRVLDGERGAFEHLVRRHNQRLYRAVRAVADIDVEDVLQSVWLTVFKNLQQFRGEAAFATWATRIPVHEAIHQARKRPVIAEVVEHPVDVRPDESVARSQLGALLERCLAEIPPGNREVMILRDVLELNTAETAACLHLSEEAVRVRLHRARAAIAARVTEGLADHVRDIFTFDGARCDRITEAVMARVLR